VLVSLIDATRYNAPKHWQATELAAHKAAIAQEFSGVIREEFPHGLPPECRLREGQPLKHAIPLKAQLQTSVQAALETKP
jgi:hypothetical protein